VQAGYKKRLQVGCGLLPKYLALVEGELMDEDTTGLDTKLNEEKK